MLVRFQIRARGILAFLCRHSVVVGAGYIAVEIVGILSTLGSKSSLLIRRDKVLLLAIPTVPPIAATSQLPTGLWQGSQGSCGRRQSRGVLLSPSLQL